MNMRPQNSSPRPTATERPQAGPSQRGDAPRRNADPQRGLPAATQSRSDARHATRVAADSEVLIVGV